MPNAAPYDANSSFAIPEHLRVETLSFDGDPVTIHASAGEAPAECPLCGRPSRRVHGRYTRTLADLPWCGTPVRIRVRVRKLFCDEPTCRRKVFAERLEEVARPFARGTDRRREALEWIAFALGGEAGARLARELGLLVSADTLLNRIRGAFRGDAEGVRVLGVDDFGFRRGSAPGTILVDLERHKVVDLFEGHSVESIARWLGRHPGVEVVARDRSHVCREGVNAGAPTPSRSPTAGTSSVASPWDSRSSCYTNGPHSGGPPRPERAKGRNRCPAPSAAMFRPYSSAWVGRTVASRAGRKTSRAPGRDVERHKAAAPCRGAREGHRRVGRHEPEHRLPLQGAHGTPPRSRYRRRPSVLDPYLPYILGRWNEGCRSAKRLHQEIREMGYRHSVDTVNRLLSSFRYTEQRGEKLPTPRKRRGVPSPAPPQPPRTSRRMSSCAGRRC